MIMFHANLKLKYPWIVQWCKEMRSYDYYIENQLVEAEIDKAPTNAIYKREDKWVTMDDVHPIVQKNMGYKV